LREILVVVNPILFSVLSPACN